MLALHKKKRDFVGTISIWIVRIMFFSLVLALIASAWKNCCSRESEQFHLNLFLMILKTI